MAKNTIIVKSSNNVRDQLVSTAVVITPGSLCERTSAGLVQKHSVAAGSVQPMFAMEDGFQGKKITDDYAVSTTVFVIIPTKGDRVYAIFDATSGGSVAIGDELESAGDGTLRKHTPQTSSGAVQDVSNAVVAVALGAVVAGARFICEIV